MFARNLFFSYIWKFATILLNMANGILLTRLLSIEDRGAYALFILNVTLGTLLVNHGVPDASIYYLGQNVDKNKVHTSNTIYTIFVFTILFIMGITFYAFNNDNQLLGLKRSYFLITLVCLLPKALVTNISLMHLGLKEIKKYNIIMIIEPLILLVFLVLPALVYQDKKGLTFYINSYIGIAYLGFLVTFVFLLKDKIIFNRQFFDRHYLRSCILLGFQFFTIGFSSFLFQRLNYWMLLTYTSEREVAFYTIAIAIPTLLSIIPAQISQIFYPYVAHEINKDNNILITQKLLRFCLFIGLILMVLLFPFLETVITFFYGNDYSVSTNSSTLLLVSMLFSGFSGIFINYFSGIGKAHLGMMFTVGNLLLSVILSYFFIKNFGFIGAALSKMIIDVLGFITLLVVFKIETKSHIAIIFSLHRFRYDVQHLAINKLNLFK